MDGKQALQFLYIRLKTLSQASIAMKENKLFADPEINLMLEQIKSHVDVWASIIDDKTRKRE